MPQFHSFAAIRFNLQHVRSIDEVIAPRPDLIDEDLQDVLYKRHPANVVRIVANRTELGDEPGDAIKRSAKFIAQWEGEGVTVRDPEPAIYVIRQTIGGRDHQAVIVRMKLESQFNSGLDQDAVRLAELLQATGVSATPTLLVARELEIDKLIGDQTNSEPIVESQSNENPFQLWRITAPQAIEEICNALRHMEIEIPKSESAPDIGSAKGSVQLQEAIAHQQIQEQKRGPLTEDDPANFVMAMVTSDAANAPQLLSGLLFNAIDRKP